METPLLNSALSEVTETMLSRLGRLAGRMLAGRPFALRGHTRGQRPGRGLEFLDFREYSPGDDLRHVDWRASARSHHHQVRRYYDEAASQWYICLDTSASMSVGDKWPLAIQMAAAYAFLILQQDNQAGVLAFNDRLHNLCLPGRGRLHYARIRHLLENISPPREGGASLLRLCRTPLKRGCSVIIISDFLTPDAMQADLDILQPWADNIHTVQILSPDECRMSGNTTRLVKDIENGQQCYVATESASVAARRRLQQLNQSLTGYCQHCGIAHTSCTTDQPWHQVITQHLEMFYGQSA